MVWFEHNGVRLPSFCGAEHVAFEETCALQRVARTCACFRSDRGRCSERFAGAIQREVRLQATAQDWSRSRASARKKLRRSLVSRPRCHADRFVSRAGDYMPRAICTGAIVLARLMFRSDLRNSSIFVNE